MKASQAFILTVALLASAPLYADQSPAPMSSTNIGAIEAAPSSATSPEALMIKAFHHRRWTCESNSPGTIPMLEPAVRNQMPCMISPFKHDQWGICPAFPPSPVLPLPPGSPDAGQQQAFIAGDQIEGIQEGVSLITGKVQLDQGDHRINAETMLYDSNTGLASIKKDVNYYTPKLMVMSPIGRYDTDKGTGSFDDAAFLLPQKHGHGTAKLLNSLDSERSQLFGVQYTTCPPGKPDWSLNAPDMSLDTSTNTGEAHDVTIEFLGLPIFWTPYLNFPISDDRKSGFLSGTFSFDVVNGFDIKTPYYINLAPNYDDTLYPRIISKRGVQLGNDFRLLTPLSYDSFYVSYLPHDMLANRDRGQFIINHRAQFTDSLSMNGIYNWISDDELFHDLNSDLPITSSTYLDRSADLEYTDGLDLDIVTSAQDYQIIDPTTKRINYPYRRIPRTTFNWGNYDDLTGPEYQVNAELVRFQRAQRLGAWRMDIEPSISLPFNSSAAYFNPTLAWRYTNYDLSEQSTTPDASHPSRSMPIFSIDTGLYFDRDAGDYIQTLEPQLFYLRVPYRNQSALPEFDTSQVRFDFFQLFSNNSFYGADRQADANQLSYALTSRVLDPDTGGEILHLDVGEIRYFSDRRVQLGATCTSPKVPRGCTPPATGLFSDITADMSINLNDEWSITHEQLWNHQTRRTDLGSVLLQYHPAYHQVVNLGYQYQAAAFHGPPSKPVAVKQTDFSFSWPVAGNWSVVGRWNYDIVNHITLEDFVGLEYENCCWDFQILHRHVVTGQTVVTGNAFPQYDNVFFFQLSLKGLVTAGRHLDDLVENGILGYQDSTFTESQQTQPP